MMKYRGRIETMRTKMMQNQKLAEVNRKSYAPLEKGEEGRRSAWPGEERGELMRGFDSLDVGDERARRECSVDEGEEDTEDGSDEDGEPDPACPGVDADPVEPVADEDRTNHHRRRKLVHEHIVPVRASARRHVGLVDEEEDDRGLEDEDKGWVVN
jgi:hypothetical protein